MTFQSWPEVVRHVRDDYDFTSPDDLWTWENFGDQIDTLRGRLGFGDDIEFLGYHLTEDHTLYDTFTDEETEPSPGFICVMTYYSLADQVEDAVTEHGDDWVNFWQLPGGTAKESSFKRRIVSRIGQRFVPAVSALEAAAETLGGEVVDDGRVVVPTLPEIRLMVSITEREGQFPPTCSVYFQRKAANYLPTDNLTDMGTLLARRLEAAASPEVIQV